MNYATIKPTDVANGPGVRVSLFVSGCTHRCPDCFNEEAWDFSYGSPFTGAVQEELLALLEKGYISGLSLLGGEPLEPSNQEGLLPFLKMVKERMPEKSIWCYSGYTFEYLLNTMMVQSQTSRELLGLLDVLVDGRFIAEQKNLNLRFRGSENQRILDVRQSLAEGRAVAFALADANPASGWN